MLLAPLIRGQAGEFRDVLEKARREGFVRVRIDGKIVELDGPEPVRPAKGKEHVIEAVVDRLVLREGVRARLADSVETALRWGKSQLVVLHQPAGAGDDWKETAYSTDYRDPQTGFTLPALTAKHFSFNSHLGACPTCHGLGVLAGTGPGIDGARPAQDPRRRRGLAVAAGRGQADARLLPGGVARAGGGVRRADGQAVRGFAGGVQARAFPRHGRPAGGDADKKGEGKGRRQKERRSRPRSRNPSTG